MSVPAMAAAAAAGEVVELMLEVPHGEVVTYDLARLCSALGITDGSRVVVETDGSRHALVTIYPANPLAAMPPPSLSDMIMDRNGRIVVGRYHNGRPARRRLFDPSTGSAVRALVFGTTGAGKSRVVQYVLACEKRNSIVSWYGDLKGGQSAPEARGNVDWYATSQEEVILMLRAAVEVAAERQRRYSALGRNAFLIGAPDPLISVRLDEANRALEPSAPYRAEATYLIKELGRTGRSVGIGEELDAQASHLEELGGSDTLRAMLKEGEVTLLRWSSSMMRQLVADGLLPAGEQLMPIPKTLAPRVLRSQFDVADTDDADDAPATAGTGYLLAGPAPASTMRHFRIGSISPLPGLDPEILALYGPGDPARLEDASLQAAGAAYAARHNPAAMAELCQGLSEELTTPAGPAGRPRVAAQSGTAQPGPAPGPTAPPRLEDRVLAALATADAPMTADEVLAAVLADGGKEVRIGSVRNSLKRLTEGDEAPVTHAGHGLYALTDALATH